MKEVRICVSMRMELREDQPLQSADAGSTKDTKKSLLDVIMTKDGNS